MYQKRNKRLALLTLYLGSYTNQFYLREISELTKIPLKTTQNLLSELEKSKILRGTIRGKNKYFGLNLDNIETKFYLLQSEIYKTLLFLGKYPLSKTFIKGLESNMPLIVFGSFAKFAAKAGSDLDILAISKPDGNFDIPSHLLPYKIHKIDLTYDQFLSEDDNTLLKEVAENHIVLNNHSFYVNAMWRKNAK